MLELLTQYLARTRGVVIPHLGSLTLESVPASWSVSDRMLEGPAFRVHAGTDTTVAEPQLQFLAGALQENTHTLHDRLDTFGQELQQHLLREPFLWPGVGLLHWQEGRLHLQPPTPVVLAPQAAVRVIREDARHSIRVGEQQVWSDARSDAADKPRRYELEWLAWLLVVLAALFTLWALYSGGFSVHATGLRTTVGNSLPY